MRQPWRSDNWFVSPWNFLPDATREYEFPLRIVFHDVTLRDGEQQAGVVFNKDDKMRIAEKLAEAGVQRIEAGMPAVSPEDAAAIKAIVNMGLPVEVFAFSRCMAEDVKRAVDCGVTGVVLEIPSSEHIIQHAYRWPVERAVELSIEATQFAHSQGLYTVFFPIDSSRAEVTWYLSLIERIATEGHMDALGLVDTFGVLTPDAVRYFVRRTRERISQPLEAHFHMDFGLGVINTIVALANGAEVAQTTVSGLGERAGNTPMEETALALLTLYGVDTGLRYEKFYELSQLVCELAGQSMPSNRQVVGERLFDVESGIITTWLKNVGDEHLTEMVPFRPELVGHRPVRSVLGKGSGIDSVGMWLDRLGITATTEQMQELLAEVKALSLEKKALLTDDEFRRLAERVIS